MNCFNCIKTKSITAKRKREIIYGFMQHTKKIDASVIDFCKSIAPSSTPEYIKLRPESWCKQNECYDNVVKKVETNGGKRQLGWRIQVMPDPFPKFMIEAVHHAIWIMENGDKIDITPQPNSAESIVFLEDNTTKLGKYRIGERYQALMKDEYVTEYVRLCNLESSEYVSKTKLDKQPRIPKKLQNKQESLLQLICTSSFSQMLPPSDFNAPIKAYTKLVHKTDSQCNRNQEHYVSQNHKKVGRNDPCPCGSGKKYKKCCILLEIR